MRRPIVQPFHAFLLSLSVIEQPGGHRKADQLVPAIRFPDDLDIGPAWLAAVIQLESELATLQVAIDEIVRGVNPWRRCLGAAVLVYELTTIL